PARSTVVLRNVISGYRSTSRKSADLRCASRWSVRVSMLAASITASTDDAVGSVSFIWMVPLTPVNRPFTVVIMRCLAPNSTSVCAGSSVHVLDVVDGCMVEVVISLLLRKAVARAAQRTGAIPSSLKPFMQLTFPRVGGHLTCTARHTDQYVRPRTHACPARRVGISLRHFPHEGVRYDTEPPRRARYTHVPNRRPREGESRLALGTWMDAIGAYRAGRCSGRRVVPSCSAEPHTSARTGGESGGRRRHVVSTVHRDVPGRGHLRSDLGAVSRSRQYAQHDR